MAKDKRKQKIRVLAWVDSPAVATGFATVSRNILRNLAVTGRYDIDVIGVNDRGGWKDPQRHPYRIYPAMPLGGDEVYGRSRLIGALLGQDRDLRPPWDIVFTLNDPFILEQTLPVFNKGVMGVLKDIQKSYIEKAPQFLFKIISYWPVDSPLKPNWVQDAVNLPDVSVAYTEYGKKEIVLAGKAATPPITDLESRLRVIYHGVDTETFFPLSDEEKKKFRKQFFQDKVNEDTFIVVAVARNQLRKDLPRTMQIFREFQKRRPDSFLYLHAKPQDAWGSLLEYAKWFGLDPKTDWGFPSQFSENIGYPLEVLNAIYNVSDVVISTTIGEGFGLPFFEAMAAKVINLAPVNTTIPELFNLPPLQDGDTYNTLLDSSDFVVDDSEGGLRGIAYKCFSSSSEWATYGPADYERVRPLGNVDDAVKRLIWIYDHPEIVGKIVDNAYEWVRGFTWKKISDDWDRVFRKTYRKLKEERVRYVGELREREGGAAPKKDENHQVGDVG